MRGLHTILLVGLSLLVLGQFGLLWAGEWLGRRLARGGPLGWSPPGAG